VKAVAAVLALVWAAGDLLLAGLMILGAFTAKTAAKEGLMAQASLLLGGLLIGAFALALGLVCLRMLGSSDRPAA
jgi:hypothetical protein